MHVNLTENFSRGNVKSTYFCHKKYSIWWNKNDGVGKEGKDKNKKGNLKIPEEIGWKEKEFETEISFSQF